MNGLAPFDLDREARELLESFVGQAALAIRNARLYQEARGDAGLPPLHRGALARRNRDH